YRCYEVQDHPTPNPLPRKQGGGYDVLHNKGIYCNLVFENKLSSLLPFVPILKGGGNENIVRKAVVELRANETLTDLEPLLSFFASFVLDIPLVQQIMRWDMIVLRESPWYQQILKEGLEAGEKQGLELGLATGLQQGLQQGLEAG
ncbi:MAG: hypothetical protein ACKPGN_21775, partial [Dolichospermum sp.]